MDNNSNIISSVETGIDGMLTPARTFKDSMSNDMYERSKLPKSAIVISEDGKITDLSTFIVREINSVGCVDDTTAYELMELMKEQADQETNDIIENMMFPEDYWIDT